MEKSDDDAVQETWETGLRQRRRRGQSSSNNIIEDDDSNGDSNGQHGDESPTQQMENSGNSRNITITNTDRDSSRIFSHGVGGQSSGAAVGGLPCHGAAVGVQSGPAIGGALCDAFAPPLHQFTTPFKAPMKNADGDAGLLVAATPSSVTTAGETAESTYLSQSSINVRRRSRRDSTRHDQSSSSNSAPSLNRQYQLLRRQMILLLGTSALGLILFLFYALPLIAFMSLALMVSSIGALLPVAISFARARYEIEMQHPLGLVRYLPDSLRIFLTETTLHEFMADTTFFMETRYLLMYFMPGLSPEQLMDYIHRLPPRHRDALLQPGLGRLMPSMMENLMRMDHANTIGGQYDLDNPATLLVEMDRDDASAASELTIGRERQRGNGNNAEVTFLEAVTSLRRTLSTFTSRQNADVANLDLPSRPDESRPGGDDAVILQPIPQTAMDTSLNEHSRFGTDDDNSSFEFSVDLSAHGLTSMLARQDIDEVPIMPVVTTASTNTISDLRNVMLELPQSSALDSDDVDVSSLNREAIQLQREYDLEGRILSEAATAAVANYTAQASVMARVAASDVIASSSSWIIRTGLFTGLIAGGGGIATVLMNRQIGGPGPSSNLISSATDGTGMGNVITSGSVSDRRSGYSLTMYGFFATSAFGFASAGIAYFIRNRARAVVAANRVAECLETPEEEIDKREP